MFTRVPSAKNPTKQTCRTDLSAAHVPGQAGDERPASAPWSTWLITDPGSSQEKDSCMGKMQKCVSLYVSPFLARVFNQMTNKD